MVTQKSAVVQEMRSEAVVCPRQHSGIDTDLRVGIRDTDVNSNHDENGDRDPEISNQTTNLRAESANDTHIWHPFEILEFLFMFSSDRIGSYWARQEMTRLENTQEVRDGEAAKHQAHGQQGGVGVGPFDLQLVDGDVAVRMVLHVLRDNGDEGVIAGVV